MRTNTTHLLILAFLLLGLTGTALILFSTHRYGVGLSPDSVGYISTARNVADGKGFESYYGTYVSQPPLFPTALAVSASIFLSDPLQSASIFNAVVFGLIAFFSGILFLEYLDGNVFLALYGVLAIVFFLPLNQVSRMAWSEPVFIFFTVIFLISGKVYLERRTTASFIALAISAMLACLARYIGITLIIAGSILIVLIREHKLLKKFERLLIFGLITFAPSGIWVARNYRLTQTFLGPRNPSGFSLYQNLTFVLTTLSRWLFGTVKFWESRLGILAVILLSIAAGYFAFSYLRNAPAKSLLPGERRLVPVYVFTFIYTTFLVISSTVVATDRINDRLLAPIYIPVILISLWLVKELVESYRGDSTRRSVTGRIIVIVMLGAWLLFTTLISLRDARVSFLRGSGGYNTATWQEDELVKYLNQHPLRGQRIYSNAPDVLYILTDHYADLSPRSRGYNSPNILLRPADIEGLWPPNAGYLIWFGKMQSSFLLSIEELQSVAKLTPLEKFSDGAIYAVSR